MVLYFLHLGKKSRFYKVIHCVFPMSFRNKHKHYFLHDNITPPKIFFFLHFLTVFIRDLSFRLSKKTEMSPNKEK